MQTARMHPKNQRCRSSAARCKTWIQKKCTVKAWISKPEKSSMDQTTLHDMDPKIQAADSPDASKNPRCRSSAARCKTWIQKKCTVQAWISKPEKCLHGSVCYRWIQLSSTKRCTGSNPADMDPTIQDADPALSHKQIRSMHGMKRKRMDPKSILNKIKIQPEIQNPPHPVNIDPKSISSCINLHPKSCKKQIRARESVEFSHSSIRHCYFGHSSMHGLLGSLDFGHLDALLALLRCAHYTVGHFIALFNGFSAILRCIL